VKEENISIVVADNNLVAVWVGPFNPLEAYCLLKGLANIEEACLEPEEDGVKIVLYKNFVQRCSFAKFLEYVFYVSSPGYRIVCLKVRTSENLVLEEVYRDLEFSTSLYFSTINKRKFR